LPDLNPTDPPSASLTLISILRKDVSKVVSLVIDVIHL